MTIPGQIQIVYLTVLTTRIPGVILIVYLTILTTRILGVKWCRLRNVNLQETHEP